MRGTRLLVTIAVACSAALSLLAAHCGGGEDGEGGATPDGTSIDSPTGGGEDARTDATNGPGDSAMDAPSEAPADAPSDSGFDAGPANVFFVTSAAFTGDLGGVAGADTKCREAAADAGLSGTFRALLGASADAGADAGVAAFAAARGWVRVDGKPFVDELDEAYGGKVFYPPMLDERGRKASVGVWTGILGSKIVGGTCRDWTASSGTTSSGNPIFGSRGHSLGGTEHWTYTGGTSCGVPAHLYCGQIDYAREVKPPPPPAGSRRMFVSAGGAPTEGGVAAFDKLCDDEAKAAKLTGTFKALIATSTASALSRFTQGGAWYRLDGVRFASYDDLAKNPPEIDSAPTLSANGVYSYSFTPVVATGSLSPAEVGTDMTTCKSWTDSFSYDFLGGGLGLALGSYFWTFGGDCPFQARAYCLEQ